MRTSYLNCGFFPLLNQEESLTPTVLWRQMNIHHLTSEIDIYVVIQEEKLV